MRDARIGNITRRDNGRMRRDVVAGAPTRSNNILTEQQLLAQFGWIGPAMAIMGSSQRWACSLNPDNEVIAAQSYPLETMAQTPAALLNQANIACAGSAGKTLTSGVWATAALSLPLTANTTTAFGARVRISNAPTVLKFGMYEIQFAITATVISYILVQVVSLPIDIVILGINNNAGKATIVPNTAPNVIIPYSATPGAIGNMNAGSLNAGDVITAETLNMRDIGNIWGAIEEGAIVI
jgi:hypothetical protein